MRIFLKISAIIVSFIFTTIGFAQDTTTTTDTSNTSSTMQSTSPTPTTTNTNTNTTNTTMNKTSSTGQYFSDTAITTKVKADLLADSDISSLKISVTTKNGNVTLKGTVPDL